MDENEMNNPTPDQDQTDQQGGEAQEDQPQEPQPAPGMPGTGDEAGDGSENTDEGGGETVDSGESDNGGGLL